MYRTVIDEQWGRYYGLWNILYVLPCGVILVAALMGRVSILVAALVVLVAVGVGMAADAWRFTHYACPQCHQILPANTRWWEAKRDPTHIAFTCDRCRVVWLTRFSPPSLE